MITNDNDFLGCIIKCKDQNNNCDIGDLINSCKMSDLDCLTFINSLESKGFIKLIDYHTIYINPIAFSAYESPSKKVVKSAFKFSVSFLKFLITYVLGILSGILISYFTHKFGW